MWIARNFLAILNSVEVKSLEGFLTNNCSGFDVPPECRKDHIQWIRGNNVRYFRYCSCLYTSLLDAPHCWHEIRFWPSQMIPKTRWTTHQRTRKGHGQTCPGGVSAGKLRCLLQECSSWCTKIWLWLDMPQSWSIIPFFWVVFSHPGLEVVEMLDK